MKNRRWSPRGDHTGDHPAILPFPQCRLPTWRKPRMRENRNFNFKYSSNLWLLHGSGYFSYWNEIILGTKSEQRFSCSSTVTGEINGTAQDFNQGAGLDNRYLQRSCSTSLTLMDLEVMSSHVLKNKLQIHNPTLHSQEGICHSPSLTPIWQRPSTVHNH